MNKIVFVLEGRYPLTRFSGKILQRDRAILNIGDMSIVNFVLNSETFCSHRMHSKNSDTSAGWLDRNKL